MASRKDELIFLPLGGLGEIGMNAALYGFGPGKKKKWILVDCGVTFGDEENPGIELILPDLHFIEERREDLVGIVITHAHEDHIGALVELWPRLKAPVYMSPFAASLLETRRLGEPGAPKIPINVIEQGGRVELGPFDVQLVPVSHSIPESNSLAIRTPLGLVVHTGDWKLDDAPFIGKVTNAETFKALGDEGVIAAISDSTNVMREGVSPGETDVAAALTEIMGQAEHRVAITTFASNVARIFAVAQAAQACGREVVLAGRSLERVASVARELGYLEGIPEFRSIDAFERLPRNKVVLLLTGSQGEPRAALARIAQDDHRQISLTQGDIVVFSSRLIPGNEKPVIRIVNALAEKGVRVVTDRDGLIHVSGHPRRGEMAKLYEWLRPNLVVPAHGEAQHLAEHVRFARSLGIPHALVARNGAMLRLAPGEPEIIDHVRHGRLLKDGAIVLDPADKAVAERRRLSLAGIVTVAIAIDGKGEIAGDPVIDVLGLPMKARDGKELIDIIADAVANTLDSLPRAKRKDSELVENAIDRTVRASLNGAWGKKPACHVLVVEV
ncbi:MAG: ribonuclease J [Salinarimonadaceae bacterium]|nr:MAG: ribonuclease J [Salinarimonadaceae bacterium]